MSGLNKLGALACEVAEAARSVLEDGGFDHHGDFVVRCEDGDNDVPVVSALYEALHRYDAESASVVTDYDGAEDPSPEPVSGWVWAAEGVQLFFVAVGVLYTAKTLGTAVARLFLQGGF